MRIYPNQIADYDARGNITSISGQFAPMSTALDELSYDGLNRLTAADGIWGSASYYYDELGNFQYTSIGGLSLDRMFDTAKNRLKSMLSGRQGYREFDYDENGNVIDNGIAAYRFDAQNRLLEVRKRVDYSDGDDDAPLAYRQTNTYDGLGMRIKSVVSQEAGGQPRRETSYFVYGSSGDLLHEYDLESGEQRDHIRLAGRTIAVVGRHRDHDSDNDGMPDYYERLKGFSVFLSSDASSDRDNDGLSNLGEYQVGGDPRRADTDRDGVLDGSDPDLAVERQPILDPIFHYLASE